MSGSVLGQVPETQAGGDPLSPTTLIYNYLREKGMPLTSDNVRRVLEGNAQNPGMIQGTGRDDAHSNAEMPIPLINDVAGTDPKTSAAPGQRKPLPTPPIPPQAQLPNQEVRNQPPEQTGFMSNATDLGRWILGRGNPPPPPTPNYQLELRNPTQPPQISGPPEQLRLSGPGGGAQTGAPPEVPRLPPPAAIPMPQVPATPTPPAATVVPANPPVPPVAMDRALEPARQPRVTVQQMPTEQLRAPPISPQAPIEQGPVARGVGNVGAGIVSGARSGGPRGAAVGGGLAAAKEIIPPLVEQLTKRAARRKPPSPRPRKKADSEE